MVFPGLVDIQAPALGVGHKDGQGQRVDQLAREMQLFALLPLGLLQRHHQGLDFVGHRVEGGCHGTAFQRAGDLHAGVEFSAAEMVCGPCQAAQHACVGA